MFVKLFPLALLVISWIVVIFYIERGRRGSMATIRRLPALDAIEEAVGRCAEMAKPLIFTTGLGRIYGTSGVVHLAGLSVLTYVAELTARNNVRLIDAVNVPELLPLNEEIIRTAYMKEGVPEQFDPNDIIFCGGSMQSFTAGVLGIMYREKIGANINMGVLAIECMHFAEAGHRLGAIQIGGTTNLVQTPFFVTAYDYFMIGEEIFAAGAYISQDPLEVGSIAGQDIIKYLIIALIAIGSILTFFGFPVQDLFNL